MHHAGAESAVKQTAYIGLGANLGARGEAMRAALRALAALPSADVERVSAFYETPPWGKTDQPPFLNAAARIAFDGTPQALLAELQRIENALGRVRNKHWGARTIDLDLLHMEGVVCADEALTLPHPYLTERAFALVPLAEIAPDLIVHGKTIASWLCGADTEGIARAPELSAPYPFELIAAWATLLSWAGGRWKASRTGIRSRDGRILFCRERLNGQTDFMLCRRFRNYGRCSGASHLTNLVRSLSSAARNAIASFCHMSGVLM